jgi:membrane fusion protein (multidrug efflux system)
MLFLVGLLFGGIFGYKVFTSYRVKIERENSFPPIAVSAMTVVYESWQSKLTATGSLQATNGVDVTTEIEGLVRTIYFTSGTAIKKGEILVELNADVEKAQLQSLKAQAEFAHITYQRDKKQFAVQGVSQETLDRDVATLKSKTAQVAQQVALVAKKTIQAPFTGRLGISLINVGQYLNPGDQIVTLQSLDPLYVNFYLPQQVFSKLALNQGIVFTTDAYPRLTFEGKITSINPKFEVGTRNVAIQAMLANPNHKLLPGMYGHVELKTGAPQEYFTVPQAAVSYNPHGDLVYILKEQGKDKKGTMLYVATQQFITVGETRGDQVQILKGVKKGDQVVTAGQLKLKNGSLVIINNIVVPTNDPVSRPDNE